MTSKQTIEESQELRADKRDLLAQVAEATERLEKWADDQEVVTITARCDAGLCGSCRGQVLSLTGNRPCAHACHS